MLAQEIRYQFLFIFFTADKLIRTDHAARLLQSRQKTDERLLAEDIVNFRRQFQQPSSRREFDLNDPEMLKKQEGVSILPGLVGEDLDSESRARRQQEQLRDWTLQQQQELDQAKELQRLQGEMCFTRCQEAADLFYENVLCMNFLKHFNINQFVILVSLFRARNILYSAALERKNCCTLKKISSGICT